MKEIKFSLSTPQRIFLEKVIHRMESGRFNIYGSFTIRGLKDIIDSGYYTEGNQNWLNSMREDYLKEFCR